MKKTTSIKTVIITGLVIFGLSAGIYYAAALSRLPAVQPFEPIAEDIVSLGDCITPTPGIFITEDSTICPGTWDCYNSTGACLNIGANNITLDCEGATIINNSKGDKSFNGMLDIDPPGGIKVNGYNNIVIKNCNIVDYDEYGIFIKDATNGDSDNITLENNSISNSEFGIVIAGPITDSNIVWNQFDDIQHNGILFESKYCGDDQQCIAGPSYNNIKYNAFNNGTRGIVLTNDTHNNVFERNVIKDASSYPIYFHHYNTHLPGLKAHDNEFTKNVITGIGSRGISFMNNASYDNNFTVNHIEGRTYANVFIDDLNLGNTFYNNTFMPGSSYPAIDHQGGGSNVFNNNHWGDCTDSAEPLGICDDPKPIYGNQDDNPLSNGLPVIAPQKDSIINETAWAIFYAKTYDNDKSELTYSIDNSNFSSMAGCWPGKNYAFGWRTTAYSAGVYNLNIFADDGEYSDSISANLMVNNTCRINKWGQMICSNMPADIMCY